METHIWIIIIVGTLVWCLVWGIATNIVISNKGYDTNWFWWGFFFGLIAFLVACAKPENKGNETSYFSESEKADAILQYKNLLDMGAITNEEFQQKKKELLNMSIVKMDASKSDEYESELEDMILEIISEQKDGVYPNKLLSEIPKEISFEDIDSSLNRLIDEDKIELTDYGKYILK